ncbi:hypothetical protein [Agarilytica rhodophyticola]|uniref:hypothetical protein n=1 Tax=Agarilytica rhodophyticola TaxID=1737490 RepID=UPI000B342D90|nr:hypothetical protein [Agarilytica rhodophyticola]
MKKIAFLSLALGMFVSVNALASDGKVYNSASCVSVLGSATIDRGNIFNNSRNDLLQVKCLGINDHSAHGIKSAWVEVKDLSATQDVSCTLHSRYNKIGTTGMGSWADTKKTSGINSDWQRLDYGSMSSRDNSHYYFRCDLPTKTDNGKSWLGAYKITEND